MPIRNFGNYDIAFSDKATVRNFGNGKLKEDWLDMLATQIDIHKSPIHATNQIEPFEATSSRMNQRHVTQKDRGDIAHTPARIAGVFNRKRSLSMSMIRRVRGRLVVSAEISVRPAQPIAPRFLQLRWPKSRAVGCVRAQPVCGQRRAALQMVRPGAW